MEATSSRIIVGMCGASGVRYGVEVLRALRAAGVETHLVLSGWAERLLVEEDAGESDMVRALATQVHANDDFAAPPCSSSFPADGMVVIPATVKTVAEIANAAASTLISRAADNMLRLRRRLVVCIRETPLSTPCLENLTRLSRDGAVVLPLSPGFYHRPESLQDLFDFISGRVLDCLGIASPTTPRWRGPGASAPRKNARARRGAR